MYPLRVSRGPAERRAWERNFHYDRGQRHQLEVRRKRSATLLPYMVAVRKRKEKLTDVRTLSFFPVVH